MLSLYSTGVTEECISTEQLWTSDRLLWMWQWTFWVREMWGISWLNDELSASHKTITIWWAQWWTVSFSQNNYNMVGRCDLSYAEMSKKQNLCKTDELRALRVVVWDKTDRCYHMQGTSRQLTIRLMAPHIAYIFDVSVIRPVCGSTSAILIWIEAWSLAWIIRLLAELKYNCSCEFWGSHGNDYKENVKCDVAFSSHLPNNSTSHPVGQLLARLSKLKYTLPYASS